MSFHFEFIFEFIHTENTGGAKEDVFNLACFCRELNNTVYILYVYFHTNLRAKEGKICQRRRKIQEHILYIMWRIFAVQDTIFTSLPLRNYEN
jgi:hypothetical protein